MKAAAALALVLAVAGAAARSADVPVPRYDGDFTIKKINYKDPSTTEICLDESATETFPKTTTITLFVTIEQEQTPHTVELEDALPCASFDDAAMPSDGQEVEYVVFYLKQDNSKEEDAAKFTFQALTTGDGDTFSCGDTNFKRTPVDTGDCTTETANPPGSGYCYALDTTSSLVTDDGCTTPKDGDGNEEDFQYCQPSAGSGTEIETSGDATVTMLSYVSKAIILERTYTAEDVAVVLNSDDMANPQFVKITEPSSIVIDQSGGVYTPSSSTYTTCVVVKGANSDPDTVTTSASITDLEVKGLHVQENNDKFYYEFGFAQASVEANANKKYIAASDQSAVTVNCEKLELEERCFGYLLQEDGTVPLTISFEDDSNTIAVNKDSLTWP